MEIVQLRGRITNNKRRLRYLLNFRNTVETQPSERSEERTRIGLLQAEL